MKSVVQQEPTGCGIAAVANILGRTYPEMKSIANQMGIYADDRALWSDTGYVRQMLAEFGIKTDQSERPFAAWDDLPDVALLSIKHHMEQGIAYWHWVVFVRGPDQEFVLDSAVDLDTNVRTDFSNMHPKWSIEVYAGGNFPLLASNEII